MLPYPGRLSLFCFLTSCTLPAIFILKLLPIEYGFDPFKNIIWLFPSYYLIFNLVLLIFLSGFAYQVGVRAAFLGMVFSAGIFLQFYSIASLVPLGWYMCFMSFFHYSEFLSIAATDLENLSVKSFILNHSAAYIIAAITSWIEFFVEWYFWPSLKLYRIVSFVGIVMCIGGETLRKAAIFTAAKNFNHIIQSVKKEDHILITHGVYRLCRHPSYVGWFYWSIGTQLVLVNPVCTFGYMLASWKFFSDRVITEEATLLNFFGEDYINYQKKVGTGLPFISGIRIDLHRNFSH